MTQTAQHDIALKSRKLAQMADELRQGQDFSITRLTSVQKLCQEPAVAARFVTYLARITLERVEQGKGRTRQRPDDQTERHLQLMTEAVVALEQWLDSPTESLRQRLVELLGQMRQEQNEYKNIPFGALRLVRDWDLLLIEDAVQCVLRPSESPYWAYQTASHYAERSSSRYAHGLIPESAPLVQDIADYWAGEAGIDREAVRTPVPDTKRSTRKATGVAGAPNRASDTGKKRRSGTAFTHRQGQFLAFIYWYTKLHRQGPSELDLRAFFGLTPPSVHAMIVKLHQMGLVSRQRGTPRSVRVTVSKEKLPELEDVAGPP
ncbi:MAG TPA: MarR family winged helix-turn-helix transcriptional regulator [Gemmataceae bacterium]|nr:MarR family winged helix-turn-helix transcriptional regulator [Gemmataceae bacterium]